MCRVNGLITPNSCPLNRPTGGVLKNAAIPLSVWLSVCLAVPCPVCLRVAVFSDVPDRPRSVRVVSGLTTSIQLYVEPPRHIDGPRVTGFVIHNQLHVTRANIGNYHAAALGRRILE